MKKIKKIEEEIKKIEREVKSKEADGAHYRTRLSEIVACGTDCSVAEWGTHYAQKMQGVQDDIRHLREQIELLQWVQGLLEGDE